MDTAKASLPGKTKLCLSPGAQEARAAAVE